MKQLIHSTKYAKQRKFLMVLPLLVLPFLTMMFWALGGGKGEGATANAGLHPGINLKLPDAKLKDDKTLNKLSFYHQAALDSAKVRAAEKLDPYWRTLSGQPDSNARGFNDYSMDANKMKVYNKLDELKKVLNKAGESSNYNQQPASRDYSLKSYASVKELDRLQLMMQSLKDNEAEDPELTQLNEMLDKIQAIQNPDKKASVTGLADGKHYPVALKQNKAAVSLLKPDAGKPILSDSIIRADEENSFYGVSSDSIGDSNQSNSIECTIPETQTIVTGSTIKLILSDEAVVDNIVLPNGTPVYGTASVTNERLKITISSIRFDHYLLPVSLNVYDMDGQEGIYVPGSIGRTVAKQSANSTIGGLSTTMVDPSIGSQAASAGIEVAKTLFSKKVKLVRVTVNAGYKVLLRSK